MKNIQSRLEAIEDKVAQRTSTEDLDMRVEVYTCELEPNCPMEKYRKHEIWAPEGLVIIDGKCQHRLDERHEI